MPESIKIGISRCLLGERVRYDGGHKRDPFLTDVLGLFVQWVGVCPEVECGLPVPREAMRLVGEAESPRLVSIRSGTDLTDRMRRWIEKRLSELEGEDLCGFIFKARSPSSGIRGVKIYSEKGIPYAKGAGLFGRAFMDRFPCIPVEDEGRLQDAWIRENFIERIFVFHRWKRIAAAPSSEGLVDFHTDHKLLLMSHSPELVRTLGKIAASGNQPLESRVPAYGEALMRGLQLMATVKKNVNVLQHIMGYFKKRLSADEKEELLEVIERYHRMMIPLIVPVTLLCHYSRKYQDSYLARQVYLDPHPAELMLRNHV